MNRLSYKDFVEYYHINKRLPLGIWTPASLNEAQLKTKYKKYLCLVDKQVENSDPKWEDVRGKVYKRDGDSCRLWKVLSLEECQDAINNGYVGQFKIITPAHFVPKSVSPSLRYEVDNIYTLSLMFHSHLDDFRNPLNGVSITKEEVLKWWKRIINNANMYAKLRELYT